MPKVHPNVTNDLAAPMTLRSPVRIVTAAALFDGHDAAINLVRRLLQDEGAEVIHLGHNRSVREIVLASVQEDAHAVAVSSYQGGHNEFFPYLRQKLDSAGAESTLIFGGGGGVVLPFEVRALEKSGVRKVFTPEDGRELGLVGMARWMLEEAGSFASRLSFPPGEALKHRDAFIARALTAVENIGSHEISSVLEHLPEVEQTTPATVVGFTGPGGAGKSSLVDEIVRRFGRDFPELGIAVLSIDPTRRRTGGALLGDRLRMNAIYRRNVFLRSFATRDSRSELADAVRGAVDVLQRFGFELVIVETAGSGQGASAIFDIAPTNVYVMTPEFGAPTQLEKIDMLDLADLVAVNKTDRPGGEDAVLSVERQLRRLGRSDPGRSTFGTCAGTFADPGVESLYRALVDVVGQGSGAAASTVQLESKSEDPGLVSTGGVRILPHGRESYLAEAAQEVRRYHAQTTEEADKVRILESAERTLEELKESSDGTDAATIPALTKLRELVERVNGELSESTRTALENWEEKRQTYSGQTISYNVRGHDINTPLRWTTLSGTALPRVVLPKLSSRADLLRFIRSENLPGYFPFTAGVFPLRRRDENPTRQFAGEGTPAQTNRRFHLLCEGQPAKRLSTAFDSVTLYGNDPDERPDIYGKVGQSGVSVATWEDMSRLYAGFDLCDPSTSVSMTINGPAPTILAMFFNAAVAQKIEKFRADSSREPDSEESARIQADVLRTVRGTVQADILKEDQAQNTCLFSTAFSLKMMGDVQEYFIAHDVQNFYSVSISGYHIAEAGANPITQLAFTLANGITYVEYYLSRGMDVNSFARNFSFFFSMGMDPEYSVLGRVARRIWAIVLRDRYGADERSQKLKYHIQTSGRSLHAREMAFNDIRTTLQALTAYYDRCNSLHTNAYDEAITTPTEASVRRALAIQSIIQKELGTASSDNPLQGSYLIDELTELVEEAVLAEFEQISARGGIPGAMETGYLRSKIQEESRIYEERKHSGELEIVGVNSFLDESSPTVSTPPVVRASIEERDRQIASLRDFQRRNAAAAPRSLERLKRAAAAGENTFDVLMEAVRFASLGQVTEALFEVGGEFRRTM